MNNHITGISVLAAMAFTVPCVCQAQDPVSALKQVQDLAAAGKVQDAVDLCDKILTKFGDPNSTIAKQFRWVLPFYAWEKADTLYKAADYDGAYKAYKAYADNKMFTEKAFMDAVKLNAPQQYEVFEARRTYAVFQQGLSLYMLGSGTEEQAGDKTKLEAAIPLLEEYYGMLQKNKVSALEKKQKLDGRVCFMLVQAYMLQPTPDFKKAGEYLDKARKAKGKLPDDMAMTGLNTVARVAVAHPETAGWVHKIIMSSPSSYNMEPLRAARYADKYLNNAQRAATASNKALMGDDVTAGVDAARSANCLFSLLPDTASVIADVAQMNKHLGKTDPFTDSGTEIRIAPEMNKKVAEAYKKLQKEHKIMEAYGVMGVSNMALGLNSNRLGKAGYQIVVDRFPDLVNGDKPLGDTAKFQLASLCRLTGDEAAAEKIEASLDPDAMGDKKNSIVVNKMSKMLKEKNWEGVLPVAEQVMSLYKATPTNKFYVSAQFATIAALYNLKRYDEVVTKAEELLNGGSLEATGKDTLKPAQAGEYNINSFFFLMDSHMKLASTDLKHVDQALEVFARYQKRHPEFDLKLNKLAPNMYYNAVDCLSRLNANTEDEAAKAKNSAQAIGYCKIIVEKWPDHALAPSADLMAASMIIAGTDEPAKVEAISILERCADSAKKAYDANKKPQDAVTFANALFWLDSYGLEIPKEGEDKEATAKRVQGYSDRYWKEADFEGCVYSLAAACLRISRAEDAVSYIKALDGLKTIIVREANYGFKNNKTNPELEKAINTYFDKSIAGATRFKDEIKEKSVEDMVKEFSGIDANDKYTNAILRMSLINAMNTELAAVKNDPAKRDQINNSIEKAFREMTATFRPDDLTSYIAVQVGDYLVKYVAKFDDPSSKQKEIDMAITYYDSVINRRRDRVAEATLGKANALAFSRDANQQKTAISMYEQVASGPVTTQTVPAMKGLAELYFRAGDFEKARDAAVKYQNGTRGNNDERLKMMMLLGQAYEKTNDSKNALLTYMNVYNQNRNKISYSAPACIAAMDVLWKRNAPSSGDRMKGDFKASDRWTAWYTGQNFINLIKRSGIEGKMTAGDRDAYNKLVSKVAELGADGGVQREDKAGKEFQRKLDANK